MLSTRPVAALVLFVALSAPVPAQPSAELLDRSVQAIPSWEEARESTDVERYATAGDYRAAAEDRRYVLEKLRYRSDGLAVVAYLYRPRDPATDPLPVIVFNRGSYVRGDIAPELLPMFHRLAEAGFAILAPMYRGSDGGEGRDEMGGADLDDLMNVTALLDEVGSLSAEHLFLYGESRGGMMVFQAIRDGFPARAAATFGAFTDLEPMLSTDRGEAMARAIWPEFEQERARIVERRSAIRWPERLSVPLLLMHGSADETVAPLQTLRLATGLDSAGKEFGVIVFPGGNHVLEEYRAERDLRAVEFFRRYLIESAVPAAADDPE